MNEPKGWVHWHPDGYALDDNDEPAHNLADAAVWVSHYEAARWRPCDSDRRSTLAMCKIITYEEAERRLAQAVMTATAEELRKERETAPKPITNPNMAPRGGIANPTEDRMMAHFRVDISKVRTSVRRTSEGRYLGIVTRGCESLGWTAPSAWEAVGRALDEALRRGVTVEPKGLQRHPWKRPDGSRIKASWEE